jgi:hypothetical protein
MHSASSSWFSAGCAVVIAALVAHGATELLPQLGIAFIENGPVELAQQAALVVAASLFLLSMCRATDERSLVLGVLAAFAILAFFRETPNCESPFYEFGPCLSQTNKDGGYALSALLAGVFAFVYRGEIRRAFRTGIVAYAIRQLRWVWPVLLAVPLLGGADIAESLHSQAGEEIGELGTYLYLTAFAISAFKSRDEGNLPILEELDGDLRPDARHL